MHVRLARAQTDGAHRARGVRAFGVRAKTAQTARHERWAESEFSQPGSAAPFYDPSALALFHAWSAVLHHSRLRCCVGPLCCSWPRISSLAVALPPPLVLEAMRPRVAGTRSIAFLCAEPYSSGDDSDRALVYLAA
ncbi:hypothetical protein VTO73DRAFT_13095 [Trametes versicolor]